MNTIIPLIGGITAKVYDDIVDTNIKVTDTFKESLKGIQWVTLTLMTINDFNFTLLFYIINVLNHLGNPDAFDMPYEYSLLLVFPFLMLLNYNTIEYINLRSLLLFIPFIITMFIEPCIITENVSLKKLISRSIISSGLIILILLHSYFNLSPSILKIVIYALGYGITSSLFQYYMLYENKKKDSEESTDNKKENIT
jgi:hypothetical protein